MDKINIGKNDFKQYNAPQDTRQALKKAVELEYTKISKKKDKKDISTHQQVFDKQTIQNLKKLYSNNVILPISTEVISSGKEANVYYSKGGIDNKEYAIKIYKTRVLQFKDREEYIKGEYRFRNRPSNQKSNPHKLIKIWAEKEFRNLNRLLKVGIKVPEPFIIKNNILLMEFIGQDSIPAKRLKDVPLSIEQYSQNYLKIIIMIRDMFQKAKLVHGDLSEYNILYYQNELIIIDVSQTMEHDHPMAIEFLKRDLYNMNLYFKQNSVLVFKLRSLFRFITDKNLIDYETKFQDMMNEVEDQGQDTDQDIQEIFMGINIPRSLFEFDYLDLDRILKMKIENDNKDNEDLIYDKLIGLDNGDQNSNSDDLSIIDEQIEQQEQSNIQNTKLSKEEERLLKKQNNKKVKLENQEKRKNKMPKKVKKQLLKKKQKQLINKKIFNLIIIILQVQNFSPYYQSYFDFYIQIQQSHQFFSKFQVHFFHILKQNNLQQFQLIQPNLKFYKVKDFKVNNGIIFIFHFNMNFIIKFYPYFLIKLIHFHLIILIFFLLKVLIQTYFLIHQKITLIQLRMVNQTLNKPLKLQKIFTLNHLLKILIFFFYYYQKIYIKVLFITYFLYNLNLIHNFLILIILQIFI